MERYILGTITLPHGVSNKETLSWFQGWVKTSVKDFPNRSCLLETIFFYEDVVKDTVNFLLKNKWHLYKFNEMVSPDGVFIKLILDEESGHILKQLE